MKIDRKTFKPFVGLAVYSQIGKTFFKINSLQNIDMWLEEDFVVFGEPDFPMEELHQELVVTDFEVGKSYFYNTLGSAGILSVERVVSPTMIRYSSHANFLTGERFLNGSMLFYDSFKSNCICLSSEYAVNENSIVGDTTCPHLNRRVVSYGAGKSYWYCPNCKEDVGNIS